MVSRRIEAYPGNFKPEMRGAWSAMKLARAQHYDVAPMKAARL